MRPVELKKDIYWVGAVDFDIRNFHHYSRSPEGSTYNAYLVCDEKNVLFDTVNAHEFETLVKHISEIIDPESIDYIVCNHLEQDHSGALPRIVKLCKPEKIFCSTMGYKSMTNIYNTEGWPIEVVKDGQRLNIGKRNITFLETRMLHWPDSMVSYLEEDKVLFSNDAFGQNIASSYRFADECDRTTLYESMKRYYYNIVLPYSPQVLKTLPIVESLDIDMIAPDHGLIHRGEKSVKFIVDMYRQMAEQKPQQRAMGYPRFRQRGSGRALKVNAVTAANQKSLTPIQQEVMRSAGFIHQPNTLVSSQGRSPDSDTHALHRFIVTLTNRSKQQNTSHTYTERQ